MTDVTAIQVVIGLRANGHADHPDWTTLDLGGAVPKDHQIVGWKYDKSSGHDDDTVGSPRGTQLGLMLVTTTFAVAAVAAFPALVTRLTEAQALAFWETKAHAHIAEQRRDAQELAGLHAEWGLLKDLLVDFPSNGTLLARRTALRSLLQAALDPDDVTPGVHKNVEKKWADMKTARGLTYVEPT